MQARGERATSQGFYGNQHTEDVDPVTVTGSKPKTTKELAAEMGMSESSYKYRSRINRALTEETILNLDAKAPNAALLSSLHVENGWSLPSNGQSCTSMPSSSASLSFIRGWGRVDTATRPALQ